MASRIYTRTGDLGDTGLFGGARVAKDDLRVEAYGAVDELNAALGTAAAEAEEDDLLDLLHSLQEDLFHIGADLATPSESAESRGRVTITRVGPERAIWLERRIDNLETELPPLTRFILPGGTLFAAALHTARAVCRRAERRCVTLAAVALEGGAVNPEIVRYLNRLSDLLFVLARVANHRRGRPEFHWNP
jgi:cob(I)alamin adenosyltransferase